MIVVIAMVVLLLLTGWETVYRRQWRKGVTVQLHFSEPAVYEGREAHLTEIIANRKRMPLPVLEIAFRIGRGLYFPDAENITESDYLYKRDVFSLLGMEQITRTYRVKAERRGHYVITQASIGTSAFLKAVHYSVPLSESDEFYVYARRTSVRGILSAYETILGETESTRKVYEDPFAFSQIREYTPLDPMKTINWKASARAGTLMVNTYTSVRSEQLRIYLDVEERRIVRQTELSEEAIACAASLAENLLVRGLPVSFVANTAEPWVREGVRGRTALSAIEQFLTKDFSAEETRPMEEVLDLCPPSPGETPVIFSKNESDALFAAARQLVGSGACLWVIPVNKGEGLSHSSEGTLRLMKREVRK